MALRNYLGNIKRNFIGSNEYEDLGFGTKSFEKTRRLINPDGSFNVVKKGRSFFRSYEAFHMLIAMSWTRFFMLVFAMYLIINLFFATIYTAIGIEELSGIVGRTAWQEFYESFFFSTQTLTTLGYGRISPVGFWAGLAAAVESLLGVLGFALITGVLYGRFSRPQPKLAYSKAIIAPYQEGAAFEFRIANMRSNELIEVEVQVTYTYYCKDQKKRIFKELKLERDAVNLMAMNWTVVHPIDENSPLFGLGQEAFATSSGEFVVQIKAFDESFSQVVYDRTSYKSQEVIYGAGFKPMYEEMYNGKIGFYLNRINDMDMIEIDSLISKQKENKR